MRDLRDGRQEAIRFIGIAKKSSGRVRVYLIARGYSHDVANQLVDDLISDGYIDDKVVARNIISLRHGSRCEAREHLLQRLARAGICSSVIDDIKDALPSDDHSLRDLILTKYACDEINCFGDDYITLNRQQQKIFRFLLSRGYGSDLIITTLISLAQKGDQSTS